MKTNNIILLIAIVVVLLSVMYAFMGGQDQTAYINEIQKEREDKERFMRNSSESPFVEAQMDFSRLHYYPVDIRYKVIANLIPIQNKRTIILATNDGNEQRYIEYAFAEFDLDGYHNKLLILEVLEMGPSRGKLFLAFGDATSAVDTYGSGRYLDVAKTPGSSTITLDFNKAYNPYCAYVDKYSCPFPPPENLLQVSIKAGEKIYHD
ncbi:MAG: DUF1684 domain-containing protein [Cyclobacteriaceae bacterium]|nr:DUF1684 domain-containing protein [Cyclobacteriaceae bacterium]MDH4296422.1 DUF1684 domain-containing protein [Cyclobacteriaceae bacterium]MDH5251065.1 DUF1684 domain-containing protein [Cyclobacteriaceae bacterium]